MVTAQPIASRHVASRRQRRNLTSKLETSVLRSSDQNSALFRALLEFRVARRGQTPTLTSLMASTPSRDPPELKADPRSSRASAAMRRSLRAGKHTFVLPHA